MTSCKKTSYEMTIIRNCTGTYVNYDNADHLVNNREKLVEYNDGQKINGKVEIVTTYDERGAVCAMYYPFKDIVRVSNVKSSK
ncbi:MAG: hypothetical protein IT239_03210 [Bacteroidia bacterium]|nr:hypothetical protein [Bacteroidia bacterium]